MARQGKVVQAAARQVDLRVIGSDRELAVCRQEFSAAAVAAAHGWTFNIPTAGDEANKEDWIVRVPIDFTIRTWGSKPQDQYGRWDAHVPGPLQDISWAKDDAHRIASGGSADAIPGGAPFVQDKRFVLLTTFVGGDADKAAAPAPQTGNAGQG